MRMRDPKLLVAYMEHADMSQARLARHADTKRQYIHMLANGQRRSCGPRIAKLIEEALGVLPGTLFMEQKSPTSKPSVTKKKTAA
jgi:transcriptional regulator with XRE-family HTH domain